jgi:putative transposase
MGCAHCGSGETKQLPKKTDLGYAMFRCGGCRRTFNERTGTMFNFLEMPTDIVFQVVLFRLLQVKPARAAGNILGAGL